jgi:phage terminase large subunit-like protein
VPDGNIIHYGAIQRKLQERREVHDILQTAFDRWGATKLSVDLTDAGFNMIQFGQGYASMSAPARELLNLVLSKKLRQPVKPDRKEAGKRIDGIVALIMAVDRLVRNERPGSVYNKRGIIVI